MDSKKSFLIGIAGGTGSGKTTIAKKIASHFNSHGIYIPHDRYYRDQSHKSMEERVKTNYDHPDSLETDLMIEHLKLLTNRKSVEVPQYDFTSHTRKKGVTTHVSPAALIVIEGILIFANETLRNMIDLKIFVDVPADIRILRRTKRDIEERGRTLGSCLFQYETYTRPMHEKFVRSEEHTSELQSQSNL